MTKKLYNPKSQAPAVYIPCWLIQISTKLISNNAKILYGRLSQWANASGTTFRSAPQLALECGMHERAIERTLKELRDIGLIGTFQPKAGGSNHFEFYDHEWMHTPINDNLVYKSHPPTNMSVPPDKYVGTPPTNMSASNIIEIKRNKKDLSATSENFAKNKTRNASVAERDVFFNKFWELHPSKKSKKNCERLWEKQNLEIIGEEIVKKLESQIKHDEDFKRGYFPNSYVYLKDNRWTDDIRPSPLHFECITKQKERIEQKAYNEKQDARIKQQEEKSIADAKKFMQEYQSRPKNTKTKGNIEASKLLNGFH